MFVKINSNIEANNFLCKTQALSMDNVFICIFNSVLAKHILIHVLHVIKYTHHVLLFFCGHLLNKHTKWKANLSTIIGRDKPKHINSVICWTFSNIFIDWFSYQIHAVDPMIQSPFGLCIFVFSTNRSRCISQRKVVALTPVNMHGPPAKYFAQFFHRQPWLFILQNKRK